MKRVVLFTAEGFEEIEALAVVDVLRRGGVECHICSIKNEDITGSHGITVKGDITMDDADFRSYDGIVLPGGMPGSENLRSNLRIVELVKDFYMSGKLTAAICAAPIVLTEAGIAGGKKITSHPSVMNRLGNCIYTENPVEVDGNIITSRGPATAISFGLAILEYLGYKEEADNLKEAMMVTGT
jgi:4-methyl-5(b-hydroxyethyl)-thiazole monophosphate biosynthesis